ncbi:MAG: Protein GlcG [Pseudomonadota bacterium]|jgi:glc operon protein GlcG
MSSVNLATKPTLNLEVVKKIAAAAEAEAKKNNWNVVISIIDDGGNLIYLQRLDGTQIGSVAVSQEKARSAFLFKRPTKALEDVVLGGRSVMMALPGITPVEGGLPLMYKEQLVGAIGVSGVKSSEDGIIAKAGADVLLA